jgi:hypothetical protein
VVADNADFEHGCPGDEAGYSGEVLTDGESGDAVSG